MHLIIIVKPRGNIHFSNTTHAAASLQLHCHIWSDTADVSHRTIYLRPFMLITRSKRRNIITLPGERKSSVCLICMKYRILFLIIIIISLGQILLSYIANTSRMHARTHGRTYSRKHAPTHSRTHARANARTHARTEARVRTHPREGVHTPPPPTHTHHRRRIAILWVCASQP